MSNPTTPFSWQMPTATDLVTDLPADFEVFGQAVATSMADLLGGSSGYILAKNSATDMDFVWIANDQGDITGVTAGTGITVTSPTGPVPTVAIDTAVTVDKTTAQTLTNKTLTSPALTTPTISTATTNGDILYGTGSGALARLGIGSASQVLTVASGVPSWATPSASASGLTLVKTQTIGTTVSSVTVTSAFSSTYDNYLILVYGGVFSVSSSFILTLGSLTTGYYQFTVYGTPSSNTVNGEGRNGTDAGLFYAAAGTTTTMYGEITLEGPNLAYKTAYSAQSNRSASNENVFWTQGMENSTTQHTAFTLTTNSGTATGGTIAVYGYQKS